MENTGIIERARALAQELGDGWRAAEHPRPYTACLVGPDGWVWLTVRHNRNKGRIEVTPCPWLAGIRNVSFYQRFPLITVADNRAADGVARDIRRRLLPDAEAFMADAYRQAREIADTIENTRRTVAQLVELSHGGLSAPKDLNTEATDVTLRANSDIIGSYGHFRVLTGGDVEIQLKYLPPAKAAAVLETLVALYEKEGAA